MDATRARTSVQIIFGFLLTVVFTPLFHQLPQTDQTIYIVTIVLGALATGAPIGPVVLLLATCTSALFLVPWLVAWYLACWFGLPLWAKARYTAEK